MNGAGNCPRTRLTGRQKRAVSRLVRAQCANWDGGNCLRLDDGDTVTCPQTISYSLCCTYFLQAVLPAAPALYTELTQRQRGKRCAVCGGWFIPKSNRGKYCAACAARTLRKQKAAHDRKRRAKAER